MGIPLAVGITARTNIQQKKLLREKGRKKVCSAFWFGLDPSVSHSSKYLVVSHSQVRPLYVVLPSDGEAGWLDSVTYD